LVVIGIGHWLVALHIIITLLPSYIGIRRLIHVIVTGHAIIATHASHYWLFIGCVTGHYIGLAPLMLTWLIIHIGASWRHGHIGHNITPGYAIAIVGGCHSEERHYYC